jgi:hypothetical protein
MSRGHTPWPRSDRLLGKFGFCSDYFSPLSPIPYIIYQSVNSDFLGPALHILNANIVNGPVRDLL